MCERFTLVWQAHHGRATNSKGAGMNRTQSWIAALAVIALAGCQQPQSGGAGATSQTSSGTTSSSTTSAGVAAGGTSSGAASGGATSTGASAQEVTLPDGLKMQDLKVGDGAIAEDGSTVQVHYTGWLTNGTKFDSSVDRGTPFSFRLGTGQVIRGWDEGVKGMRVGGKRKLTIPPSLGYGDRGAGDVIPPGATLLFDVELLSVH
jgi:FKBP-type peptidyl-prolyl cis-trans isomerase FkpA